MFLKNSKRRRGGTLLFSQLFSHFFADCTVCNIVLFLSDQEMFNFYLNVQFLWYLSLKFNIDENKENARNLWRAARLTGEYSDFVWISCIEYSRRGRISKNTNKTIETLNTCEGGECDNFLGVQIICKVYQEMFNHKTNGNCQSSAGTFFHFPQHLLEETTFQVAQLPRYRGISAPGWQ